MTEIEDRGVNFKSWKSYAKALSAELRCLQQFLSTKRVEAGFRVFEKEARKGVG